jgi:chromosome segregation ATPase
VDTDTVTVQILTEIRDEIRGTNSRLDQTNVRIDHLETSLGGRIDETNRRIDETNTRVDKLETSLCGKLDKLETSLCGKIDETNRRIDETNRRMADSEIWLSTAIVDVVTAIGDVRELLTERRDLRIRVERCEQDIDELKRRFD